MKKMFCFAFVTLACFMTACSTVTSDLTEEQGDIIAEYAADMLLKYDKNYSDKYVESQPTTEEATFGEEIEFTTPEASTSGKKNESDEQETTKTVEETTTKPVLSSIDQILGLNGIKVTCKDFILTDTYPNDTKDNFFVMKAVENTKLLIVKLNVKNETNKDINLNVMKQNAKYRMNINGDDKLVAQITLLLNAFNTYEGTIKANKSEEMVLVFQTSQKSKTDIKSMTLDVYCGDKQGTITLK